MSCVHVLSKQFLDLANKISNVLPLTEAVRVQLYRMANSPKTLPSDNVHKYRPFFVTSTVPSKYSYSLQLTIYFENRFVEES